DDAVERLQMAGLVPPGMVDAGAAAQAGMRQCQTFPGDLEQIAIADPRLEAQPRYVVAQPLPLMGVPVLGDVPGSIEAHVVIEQADPERWQRRQPTPRTAVRAAHLEIALQPH